MQQRTRRRHRVYRDIAGGISFSLSRRARARPSYDNEVMNSDSGGTQPQPSEQPLQYFFLLAERFRNASDPVEIERLGDELGRLIFS